MPILLIASRATWQRAASTTTDETGPSPDVRWGRIVVAGVSVGLLTGFFGGGGGFLIVPVLTLWLGFSFRRAVAERQIKAGRVR
ncbi:MAG: TSUP family transporter [Solirubrobacteraceae bacterium]